MYMPFSLDESKFSTLLMMRSFFLQVLMVSADKPEGWMLGCTTALKDALTKFSSPVSENAFSLFDSSPYCAGKNSTGYNDTRDHKPPHWMKNKDLIFKDRTGSLEVIPKVNVTVFCLLCLICNRGN